MKTFLAVMVFFAVVTLHSQTPLGNDSMEAQIRRGLALRPNQDVLGVRQEKPNEIKRGHVTYSGIFVQVVKTDKPLELINPAAPPEYGSSWDNVVETSNSSREGLKLFSVQF